MTHTDYNDIRNKRKREVVKGWFGKGWELLCAVGFLALTALIAVLTMAKDGCEAGKQYSSDYSQRHFAEAEALKQQGQQQKAQDNQEFDDGLKKEREVDLSESEVESDLEDSFIELSA